VLVNRRYEPIHCGWTMLWVCCTLVVDVITDAIVDVTTQCTFDQSRYQSKHSELATLADVFTFRPHRICFTAPSTLRIVSIYLH
jgi:hypothetical protein